MAGFAQELGVKCAYCHTTDFDEETSRKQVARFMITEFTHGLLKQDGSPVNCADCHHGHGRLLSVVPFSRRAQ
jgi:nitrate/TMAO reductase-like tetraheme cytochrome c subunit